MSNFELKMPKMGESVEEATITKWFVKENDLIVEEQVLLEIATDKVDSEIPSPVSGKISKLLFSENDKVAVGSIIALIEMDSSNELVSINPEDLSKTTSYKLITAQDNNLIQGDFKKAGRFYSPLVKSISQKEKISITELEQITGTGKDGRVRKNDLVQFIEKNRNIKTTLLDKKEKAEIPSIKSDVKKISLTLNQGDEIVEMDRMRKLIAEHMLMSKRVSPHVTNVIEADVTTLVIWREKVKKIFEKRENIKLTYMPIFIEAVSKTLKKYPYVNASVEDTRIILKKAVNIGIAVALPSGNLIVPVIKNSDQLSLLGITSEMNRLAENARKNKLTPDDIIGGTFTITNFGSFRNLFGTPIINQPQVAILATGMIEKKPSVLETPTGDVFAVRNKMYLSLTYDHRIIDGAMGGAFLKSIVDYLENWKIDREI